MEQILPDWHILIKHWTDRGGIGYTLPFLVGARCLREGNVASDSNSAHNLLREMFTHSLKSYVLQAIFCNDLQSLVFGRYRPQGSLFGNDYSPTNGKFFYSPETQTPSIFIRQDMIDKYGHTLDLLITNITDEFKDQIAKGNFSRSSAREWQPFSESEIFRIRNVFNQSTTDTQEF